MKHKTLSLYVPCLDGGCEDAGRVDLAGYTLISDKRLYDLEAAEQDALEQARLNGMGSERELALMAKLEAAEKNNSAWLYANAPGGWIDNLRVKCEALRARIAQVDRQEPVAWMCSDKALIQMGYKKFSDRCEGAWDIPVFAGIPGAQGEDK